MSGQGVVELARPVGPAHVSITVMDPSDPPADNGFESLARTFGFG
jgi:hypothetical protein